MTLSWWHFSLTRWANGIPPLRGWIGDIDVFQWIGAPVAPYSTMIRKLKSGEYRLYSRKPDPKSGKRRNLGTFKSRAAAEKHEKAVQFFKRH